MDEPFFALLDHLRDELTAALSDAPADSFISVFNPPADCCDYLAVWITAITPSEVGSFPQAARTRQLCGTGYAVSVEVKLMRPCWPAGSPIPGYDQVEAAAELLNRDASELMCKLTEMHDEGMIAPWSNRRAILGTMTPLPPMGGCTGYRVSLTVHIPRCCDFDDAS